MSVVVWWARTEAVPQPVSTPGTDDKAGRWIDEALVWMPMKELVRAIGVAHGDTERFEAFTQEVKSAKRARYQGQKPYAICINPHRGKRRSRCTDHEADPACECSSRCWCLRGHENRLKEKSYAKCTSALVVGAIQGLMGKVDAAPYAGTALGIGIGERAVEGWEFGGRDLRNGSSACELPKSGAGNVLRSCRLAVSELS